MRIACRLTNGDGVDFEYATVEITPEYIAWLFQLADKAAEIKRTHDAFYAIEAFDSVVEYGSGLGESIDCGGQWAQIRDNHRWPDGCLQSVSAATVVVAADSIHWRATAKHGDDGAYFETAALTVARLREMFPLPAAICDCEQPGYFRSGVPGILARVKNGRLVDGAKVERCDSCERYPSDKAAFETLVELGIASRNTQEPRENHTMDRYVLYDFDADELATTMVYRSYEEAEDDASRLDNGIILRLPLNDGAEQALAEIVSALYADRETGELTGENTIPEKSGADFVDAVADILDRYGHTPPNGHPEPIAPGGR